MTSKIRKIPKNLGNLLKESRYPDTCLGTMLSRKLLGVIVFQFSAQIFIIECIITLKLLNESRELTIILF